MDEFKRYLSVESAAKDLDEGATVYIGHDRLRINNSAGGYRYIDGRVVSSYTFMHNDLYQKAEPKKRYMNQWECLAWVQSADSNGWLVRYKTDEWALSARNNFGLDIENYQRARFDSNGIIEDTITDFKVETN